MQISHRKIKKLQNRYLIHLSFLNGISFECCQFTFKFLLMMVYFCSSSHVILQYQIYNEMNIYGKTLSDHFLVTQ